MIPQVKTRNIWELHFTCKKPRVSSVQKLNDILSALNISLSVQVSAWEGRHGHYALLSTTVMHDGF